MKFKLSESQKEIVDEAFAKMKAQIGETKNWEGRALEYICVEFLNDPNYKE